MSKVIFAIRVLFVICVITAISSLVGQNVMGSDAISIFSLIILALSATAIPVLTIGAAFFM